MVVGWGAVGVCIQHLARVSDVCDSEGGKRGGEQLEPPSTRCLLGSVHTSGLHAQLLTMTLIWFCWMYFRAPVGTCMMSKDAFAE